MKVLVAPDKFKGSLTAQQVCDAIANGIQSRFPTWPVVKEPLADGGEGTCDILTRISKGKTIEVYARDPLFRKIKSSYGLSADGTTAFVEMARASGLFLLNPQERNPRLTSSIGTGDLIADALNRGVSKIIIGCGGSATHDGGIGMASALGVSFQDAEGQELLPIGENLSRIRTLDKDRLRSEILTSEFQLLSDVNNPLTGSMGAAAVYGTQKGATQDDIILLDQGLENLATILEQYAPGSTTFAGAGAAGGFPVSAKAFLKAEITSGIEFVMNFSQIEEKMKTADLVITGEGKFDSQSLQGKVVSGVARLCRQYQKPLWLICGVNEVPDEQGRALGVKKVISLVNPETSPAQAVTNAMALIRERVEEACETFKT